MVVHSLVSRDIRNVVAFNKNRNQAAAHHECNAAHLALTLTLIVRL